MNYEKIKNRIRLAIELDSLAIDEDIIESTPNYDDASVCPNKYGAFQQGAQWMRNKMGNIKWVNSKDAMPKKDSDFIVFVDGNFHIGCYNQFDEPCTVGICLSPIKGWFFWMDIPNII